MLLGMWMDGWGYELSESFVVTDGGAECFASVSCGLIELLPQRQKFYEAMHQMAVSIKIQRGTGRFVKIFWKGTWSHGADYAVVWSVYDEEDMREQNEPEQGRCPCSGSFCSLILC